MGIIPGRQSLELSFEEKIRKEGKFLTSSPASPLASHSGQQGVFMVRLGPETQEPTGPAGPQKMEMYLFHLSITSGDLSTIGFPPTPQEELDAKFLKMKNYIYI